MFGEIDTFAEFVGVVVQSINAIVWLLSSIALLLFIWTGVRFMWDVKGGKTKAERKQAMVWSLVALFVLFSIAGITNLLIRTFLPEELGGAGSTGAPYREDWVNYPVPIDPDLVL